VGADHPAPAGKGPLRRRSTGRAAFAGFGALGLIAIVRDPLTDTLIAIVTAAATAAAGWVALCALLDRARASSAACRESFAASLG